MDEDTNQYETSIFRRPNAVNELPRKDERAKTRINDHTVGREPEICWEFGRFAFRPFRVFVTNFLFARHHIQ